MKSSRATGIKATMNEVYDRGEKDVVLEKAALTFRQSRQSLPVSVRHIGGVRMLIGLLAWLWIDLMSVSISVQSENGCC